MRSEEILKVLKEAETPLTTQELSERTGIDIVRLSVDLFRLAEKGKIERMKRGNKLVWAISISAIEKR